MNHLDGVARRSRTLAVCLLLVLMPTTGLAAPGSPVPRDLPLAADSDGDGIADDFDPDDDNDGVSDDQEGSAGNPGPDILDPGKDTDDDGISNVHDPDDNNNGVTDEEDPASFPSPGGGGSSNPPSSQGPSTAPRQPSTATGGQTESGTVIRALPVTGTGPEALRWEIPALLAMLLGSLGAVTGWTSMPAAATTRGDHRRSRTRM